MKSTIPSRVDLTQWDPSEDVNGNPVAPGDYVSAPCWPKGTVRGTLELSTRSWTVLDDGREVGALVLVSDDGPVYGNLSKVRKLKNKNRKV